MNEIIARLKKDIENRGNSIETTATIENTPETHKQRVREINEVIARLKENTAKHEKDFDTVKKMPIFYQ